MKRRDFLTKTSLLLGSSLLPVSNLLQASTALPALKTADWKGLRQQFALTHDYIHLATFLLASHPKPVAAAIERHRKAFDENPADYWHEHFMTIDHQIAATAAEYMGGEPWQIALTDSTTMGLALVYSGLKLRPGDEILQTVHDHYSTDLSLQLRADRTGAKVRQVTLYDDPAQVSVDEVVSKLKAAINAKTKVVAVTWVHSSTGVKLPVRAIADMLNELNNSRAEAEQIIFCVDGVHGFGIENVDVSTLGCDFFIAGTHKWIFGPRGTGVIWGSERGWQHCNAVIPSFSQSYDVWLGGSTQDQVPIGEHMSPGGFHSFEHRWALPEAFKLHLQLGKADVQARIHQLNSQTKQGLANLAGVKLYTPMSPELSSGLVCFDYKQMSPEDVVKAMHKKGVIMSATPYRQSYARFAPSLVNNEQEIEQALATLNSV
ncbi:MAG: aminotransferase [Alteromonadaceae bacterium]|jgi:selenocysteine lyase/cysteine desulfurase|uniref:aminotransferase class V-fold PLP-dependent enzyme n=2 Tax=Chromatiaceae TaxID=1046 RepID=UPI000C5A4AEE|nr:aminotransferase class V-fold PLP-dependent enzyme [Rheinheimera aquimaris]MBJ92396.1 aminotransferase [Alteromonadaceae bacterium]MCD1599055.1 aminotransferase class V-fold PLP-dependent enzyme [Rheinheimera aquimaris]